MTSGLALVAMDDTEAAEPVLDATEPAPSADETHSIYAWANEGDETELIQRRSWKLPLAAVMLAAAGLAVGVVTVWPHHSTLRSPAAPPRTAPHRAAPPSRPALAANDQAYIDSLKSYGFKDMATPPNEAKYEADLIALGRGVCELLNTGEPLDLTVQAIHDEKTPGITLPQTHVIADDAIGAYCPQYAQR